MSDSVNNAAEVTHEQVLAYCSALTLPGLESLKKEIEGILKGKERQRLNEAKQEIAGILQKYNVSLDDVAASGVSTRAPVVPKYRSPDDASLVWSGRGRKPQWVVDFLEKGGQLEQLAI